MRLSASFSARSFGCLGIVVGLLLAGCMLPAVSPPSASSGQSWRIVVLPVENLFEQSVPLMHIEQALFQALQDQGMQLISGEPLNAFMERHRVRYTGGIDAPLAAALRAELAADAILISTVENYAPSPTPRIGLFCRLVSAGDAPEILWVDSVGMTGDAAPGLLDLGLVEDFDLLLAQAVDRLTASLVRNLAGDAPPSQGIPDIFVPVNQFRSPVLGADLREVVVGFAQERRLAVEGDVLQPEVVLSRPAGHKVRVTWSVTGGSARGDGIDYQANGGVLTFPPGETRQDLTIVTRDDVLHEGDETLLLRLTLPQGALPGKMEQLITLADNDPLPRAYFLNESQTVAPDAGNFDIVVELSAPSGHDVAVPFSLSGEAQQDVVYRLVTVSPLLIRAGERSNVIKLVVNDSGPSRNDAAVTVQLGDPRDALLGKSSRYTLTIRGHGWKLLPSIAVMPFVNESRRKSAGALLSLHLMAQLHKSGRFQVVEPGIVRDRFLEFRLIRPEGISVTDAEALARNMETDLLLLGRVLDYQDIGGVPRIGFSAVLIERESRKVVWSASSEGSGLDPVTLFDLGRIGTTNELASSLAASLINALLD